MSIVPSLELEDLRATQAVGVNCPIRHALAEQIAFAATPIAMVDTEMRYIAASPAWCTEYKLDVTSILGKSHYEIFPEIPKRWRELHRRSLAGEALSSELDLFARARGVVQWLRWSTKPWRTMTGEIGGLVMVVDSVNEVHRLRAAAEELHTEFEALFENQPVGIVLADWSGRVLRANRAFASLVDRTPGEVAGLELAEFFEARGSAQSTGHERRFSAFLQQLRDSVDPSVTERFALHSIDDRTTWLQCTATRVQGSNGAAPRIVLFLRDESAQIEFERRMRVADRLASLGMLSAGLGHDLQNVLLPIQAHLNALAALGAHGSTKDARERHEGHIDAMRSCVAYLRQLADGMHYLSRDSTSSAGSDRNTQGRAKNKIVCTELCSWWVTVEPLLSSAMPREIRFAEHIDPRCLEVLIDPSVLTQLVLNLVVNARDAVVQRHGAHGRGGEIRAEFAPARLEKRRAVRIAISDNGVGMSAEVRERAREAFFTTKPAGRGTGLGLAMVSKAVEEAHGEINITSAPGEGTTIEVMLPASRSDTRQSRTLK